MHEDAVLAVNDHSPSQRTPRYSRQDDIDVNIVTLSIVIPCYNEADTIGMILDKVLEVHLIQNIRKEIIIVNDCSTDDTEEVISKYLKENPSAPIRQIRHSVNKGKGAAIHTGLAEVTGEYVLIQDADLEYDPGDYNLLLKPVVNGHAHVVYGSRFMGGNPHRILFFWHTIGNRLLTFISNMFTNLNLTDMETGYKLFKTSVIRQIDLREKRFGFEPEVTVKISRLPGIKLYEVGIAYYGRTYDEGKKIGMKDAFRCIYCLIKYKIFSHGQKSSSYATTSRA